MTKLETKNETDQPFIGAWQQIPSPVSAEAMCSLGFDWIAVDLEHSRIGAHQAEETFIVAELYDMACFARIPKPDPYIARKLLDSGATGLIVAGIEDPEKFSRFAEHCRYAPSGIRGVGLSRSNQWGKTFVDQMDNFRPLLVPQIESVKGIAAAREIADVKDVYGLFLGPYDLSTSLGQRGNFNTTRFIESQNSFLQACFDKHILAGIHQVEPDPRKLEERIADGFRLIAYGTDVIAMRHALKNPRLGHGQG